MTSVMLMAFTHSRELFTSRATRASQGRYLSINSSAGMLETDELLSQSDNESLPSGGKKKTQKTKPDLSKLFFKNKRKLFKFNK